MTRRPLAALASVVLAGLGVVFLVPDCASACMCSMLPGGQKERAERALSDSDAVFAGEVVGLETPPTIPPKDYTGIWPPGPATATVRVSEVWKGPKQRTVRFTTPVADGVNCAIGFEEGREYLVYADVRQDDLKVDGCSETKPLSRGDADLALLGDGEKPKDGGTLTDTSGGSSGPALAGLAGLALAASLLAVSRLVRAGRT